MNKTNEKDRPTDRPNSTENPSEGDSLVTAFNRIINAFYGGQIYPQQEAMERLLALELQRVFCSGVSVGLTGHIEQYLAKPLVTLTPEDLWCKRHPEGWFEI